LTIARWVGGIAVLVCVALVVSFKLYERQFRLGHVPEGLNVSTVLYANEQSWGLPLNRYGFGISIDAQIEQEINQAISKPGSFAAYGRTGILIVIPGIRRVVYAHNG